MDTHTHTHYLTIIKDRLSKSKGAIERVGRRVPGRGWRKERRYFYFN